MKELQLEEVEVAVLQRLADKLGSADSKDAGLTNRERFIYDVLSDRYKKSGSQKSSDQKVFAAQIAKSSDSTKAALGIALKGIADVKRQLAELKAGNQKVSGQPASAKQQEFLDKLNRIAERVERQGNKVISGRSDGGAEISKLLEDLRTVEKMSSRIGLNLITANRLAELKKADIQISGGSTSRRSFGSSNSQVERLFKDLEATFKTSIDQLVLTIKQQTQSQFMAAAVSSAAMGNGGSIAPNYGRNTGSGTSYRNPARPLPSTSTTGATYGSAIGRSYVGGAGRAILPSTSSTSGSAVGNQLELMTRLEQVATIQDLEALRKALTDGSAVNPVAVAQLQQMFDKRLAALSSETVKGIAAINVDSSTADEDKQQRGFFKAFRGFLSKNLQTQEKVESYLDTETADRLQKIKQRQALVLGLDDVTVEQQKLGIAIQVALHRSMLGHQAFTVDHDRYMMSLNHRFFAATYRKYYDLEALERKKFKDFLEYWFEKFPRREGFIMRTINAIGSVVLTITSLQDFFKKNQTADGRFQSKFDEFVDVSKSTFGYVRDLASGQRQPKNRAEDIFSRASAGAYRFYESAKQRYQERRARRTRAPWEPPDLPALPPDLPGTDIVPMSGRPSAARTLSGAGVRAIGKARGTTLTGEFIVLPRVLTNRLLSGPRDPASATGDESLEGKKPQLPVGQMSDIDKQFKEDQKEKEDIARQEKYVERSEKFFTGWFEKILEALAKLAPPEDGSSLFDMLSGLLGGKGRGGRGRGGRGKGGKGGKGGRQGGRGRTTGRTTGRSSGGARPGSAPRLPGTAPVAGGTGAGAGTAAGGSLPPSLPTGPTTSPDRPLGYRELRPVPGGQGGTPTGTPRPVLTPVGQLGLPSPQPFDASKVLPPGGSTPPEPLRVVRPSPVVGNAPGDMPTIQRPALATGPATGSAPAPVGGLRGMWTQAGQRAAELRDVAYRKVGLGSVNDKVLGGLSKIPGAEKALGVLGKLAIPLGMAATAYGTYSEVKDDESLSQSEKVGSVVGAVGGMTAGAATGASVGAFFGGPIGAAIGGIVGGLAATEPGKAIGRQVGEYHEKLIDWIGTSGVLDGVFGAYDKAVEWTSRYVFDTLGPATETVERGLGMMQKAYGSVIDTVSRAGEGLWDWLTGDSKSATAAATAMSATIMGPAGSAAAAAAQNFGISGTGGKPGGLLQDAMRHVVGEEPLNPVGKDPIPLAKGVSLVLKDTPEILPAAAALASLAGGSGLMAGGPGGIYQHGAPSQYGGGGGGGGGRRRQPASKPVPSTIARPVDGAPVTATEPAPQITAFNPMTGNAIPITAPSEAAIKEQAPINGISPFIAMAPGRPGSSPTYTVSDIEAMKAEIDAREAPRFNSAPRSAVQDPAFVKETQAMAERLGIKHEDLMAVMNFESKLDPTAKNPGSSASGLIQFMRDTATGLGTDIETIRKMNHMEQLPYVEKYLKGAGVKPGTDLSGLYMSILAGNASKAQNASLWSQGTEAYDRNSGLDVNGDGTITPQEATQKVRDNWAAAKPKVQPYIDSASGMPGDPTSVAPYSPNYNPVVNLPPPPAPVEKAHPALNSNQTGVQPTAKDFTMSIDDISLIVAASNRAT